MDFREELFNSLDNLKESGEKFKQRLDTVSNYIRDVEEVLNHTGFKMHFRYDIPSSLDTLEWNERGSARNFRVFYAFDNDEFKPLGEYDVETKLRMYKYLPEFVTAISLEINNYTENT